MTIATSILVLALGTPSGAGLHFVHVGQGAAAIALDASGEAVLIDSGPSSGAEALLRAIDEHELGRVELWVHTHFDADHIGGFSRVLAGADGHGGTSDDLELARLWDRGTTSLPDTDAVALYFALAGERRGVPNPGERFELGELWIERLELDPIPAAAPENERGLALCLEIGSLRVLIPGDLPGARVEAAAEACGPVDVLWASHHGAAGSLTAEALALADPTYVVISAGPDNGYCHPSASTIALLAEREVWLLDVAGSDPRGECPPLADTLGPGHRLIGADLWIGADQQVLLGMPGGGWSY